MKIGNEMRENALYTTLSLSVFAANSVLHLLHNSIKYNINK
jgi:hypothetical protein